MSRLGVGYRTEKPGRKGASAWVAFEKQWNTDSSLLPGRESHAHGESGCEEEEEEMAAREQTEAEAASAAEWSMRAVMESDGECRMAVRARHAAWSWCWGVCFRPRRGDGERTRQSVFPLGVFCMVRLF